MMILGVFPLRKWFTRSRFGEVLPKGGGVWVCMSVARNWYYFTTFRHIGKMVFGIAFYDVRQELVFELAFPANLICHKGTKTQRFFTISTIH